MTGVQTCALPIWSFFGTGAAFSPRSAGAMPPAYILKDCSSQDSPEACYEMVEEEEELQAVYKVFEQMLDDVDLEM